MSIDRNLYKDKKIQLDWICSSGVFTIFYRVNASTLGITNPLSNKSLRELRDILNKIDLEDYKDEINNG